MWRAISSAALVAVAVALSACGAAGSGGAADPARAAPRDAPFYAEVVVRPGGDVRDDALAAAGRLLRTDDPAGRIRELVQRAFASGEHPVDFARDVEPWLGERIGLWVTSPTGWRGGRADVAAAIAVSDEDAARDAIPRLHLEPDAVAVVRDGFLLTGTRAGVQAGEAALDGDGLAGQDRYADAIDELDDDRLGLAYLDTKAIVDAALRRDPEAAAQLGPLRGLIAGAQEPQAMSFSADAERLAVDAVTRASQGAARGLSGLLSLEPSRLLAELPGRDTWAALAIPEVGASLRATFDALAGALGAAAVAGQLRSEYGVDLQEDVFAWMGDAGLFVRGTQPRDVSGALVIEAADGPRATAAFGKLVGLLRTRGRLDPRPVSVPGADSAFAVRSPGARQPAVLARGRGRVVVAYGEAAAAEALAPRQALADTATYDGALSVLGDAGDPSFVVSVPAILALAEASGAAGDPDFARAKPYLQALGAVAATSSRDGDEVEARIAVGLR